MNIQKNNSLDEIYSELGSYYMSCLQEINKSLKIIEGRMDYNKEYLRYTRIKLENMHLIELINLMYIDYASMFLWWDYCISFYKLEKHKFVMFSELAKSYDSVMSKSPNNSFKLRINVFIKSLVKAVAKLSERSQEDVLNTLSEKFDKVKDFV